MQDPDLTQLTAPSDAPERAGAPAMSTEGLIALQELTVRIVNALLGAPARRIDAQIDTTLREIGEAAGSDRTYVFRSMDDILIDNTHEWHAPGIPSVKDQLQGQPIDQGRHWFAAFRAHGHLQIPDVSALPEDDELRDLLQAQGVVSLLAVPLYIGDRIAGFVGHDAVRQRRCFTAPEIGLVQSVANAIGTVLYRRETELEIARARAAQVSDRNRLQAMMRALPDLVMEMNAEGIIVGYHQTTPMRVAIEPAEVVGQIPEAFLPPHLVRIVRRAMAEVDARGHSSAHDYALDLDHGRRWYSLFAAARLADIPGMPHGYVFVVRDITNGVEQRHRIAQLDAITRQTTNLVFLTDRQQRITWMNPAASLRTGFTLAEVLGKDPCAILRLDECAPDQARDLRAAFAHGTALTCELQTLSRDGAPYWVDLQARPLYDIEERPLGFTVVLSDISDRKQQELALARTAQEAQEARQRLAAAVAALEDGFVYFDADQRLVLCNQTYRDLYPKTGAQIRPGITLSELVALARDNNELTTPMADHRIESHPAIRRFADQHREQQRQWPDGRWIRVIEKATPDGGKVALMVDITALKRAEQRALRDRERVLDASRAGIAVLDGDGFFSYFNSAMARMLEFPKNTDVIGSHWTSFIDAALARRITNEAAPQLLSEGHWEGQFTRHHTARGTVDHELSVTRDDEGRILCILRDISQRVAIQLEQARLRDELQLAQRREVIAQLAAGLAHDFGNLLMAISGSAALVRTAPPEQVRQHARRIAQATEQAGALVRRLIALGSRPACRRRIDLSVPMREAAELVRTGLRADETLSLQTTPGLSKVMAEPTDVLQVVLNLCLNARDALRDNTAPDARRDIRIGLRTASKADMALEFDVGHVDWSRRYLRLSVRDTGAGMDATTRARAFEPYVSTKGTRGTGLGLPIVRTVVSANDGAIALRNRAGGGTEALVLWPVANPPDDGHDTTGAAPPAGTDSGPAFAEQGSDPHTDACTGHTEKPLRGGRILVVDDDDPVLLVVCRILEDAGAETAACVDPRDALATIKAEPGNWDLVVTDHNMPHMSGMKLVRALDRIAPGLPIIIMTGQTVDLGADTARHPALFKVIDKPLSPESLVTTVATAIVPKIHDRG